VEKKSRVDSTSKHQMGSHAARPGGTRTKVYGDGYRPVKSLLSKNGKLVIESGGGLVLKECRKTEGQRGGTETVEKEVEGPTYCSAE